MIYYDRFHPIVQLHPLLRFPQNIRSKPPLQVDSSSIPIREHANGHLSNSSKTASKDYSCYVASWPIRMKLKGF